MFQGQEMLTHLTFEIIAVNISLVGFVPVVPIAMEEQMYAEEDVRGSKVEIFVLIVMNIASWLTSRDDLPSLKLVVLSCIVCCELG